MSAVRASKTRSANGKASTPGAAHAAAPQSAAMPSPFPPIADYAFLSDCHTGALVAPDGTIDWLCVPRFDAPSVFGTLLDRQAGAFRFAPFGINVPTQRAYEPGTNTLLTTWRTPGGWMLVREALTLGPRRGVDVITPHTRPPADSDAEHLLVRVATCIEGEVEIELTCEPVFDYGRVPAEWSVTDDGHSADASGAGVTIRLRTDMAVGCEGGPREAGRTLRRGEEVFCSLTWSMGSLVRARRRGQRAPRHDDPVLARLARPGAYTGPPVASVDHPLGAHDQRSHVHADRGHGRGAHDLAAGDARGCPELGLSLHLAA